MKTKLFFLMLLAFTTIKAQVPTDQVASYNFTNGSLINDANPGIGDLSGSTPTLRQDRYGRSNFAMRANAVPRTGYSLSNAGNNYTVSFWFQGGGPSGTSQNIFEVKDGSGNGFYLQNKANNVLEVGFKNSNVNFSNSETISSLYDSGWHHVSLTIDYNSTSGYDNNLYIDGVINTAISNAISTTDTGSLLVSNASFVISPSSLVFYDQIDDINIYERALNSTEIYELFTDISVSGDNKYFVDATATGNNDGSSWDDAFTSLQTALTFSTTNTTEIWIATGTYVPGTGREDSFDIDIDGLSIYGGFNGTETTLSQRDVIANPTILSGDASGNDTTFSSNHNSNSTRYDNSYNVVTVNANNILIDGLKIEDGYANHTTTENLNRGGAIRIDATSENLILRNCEFNHNFSLYGGVRVLFTVNTQMTIENCKFNDNAARYGSGLYVLVDANKTVILNVTNTLFTNNTSLDIYSAGSSYTGSSAWLRAYGTGSTLTSTITNCTFANNSDTGTASVSERGTLGLSSHLGTHNATINNSIFYGNTGTSVNKGHETAAITAINNSIGENSFSNQTNLTNTSNSNPLFTDAANNDFTLQTSSPAIDTGNNTFVTSTTDLLGNQRIFNTTVDKGPYEFDSSILGNNDFVFKENEIKLYPNPASTVINIKMIQNLKQVIIYSMLGKEVLRIKNKSIDVSNLSNGLFLIKIEDQKGNVSTKRFIKQ